MYETDLTAIVRKYVNYANFPSAE